MLDGQQPGASFVAPNLKQPQVLRFALTASDPRGAVTAVTAVRLVPDQIASIDPKLTGEALARASLHANPKPVTGLPLTKADAARVSVAAPGAYTTREGGSVRLDARVQGQRVSMAGWSVSIGPRSMLAGATRSGAAISFRAPPVPGTYAVHMTAKTAAGSFSRDELIEVNPGVRLSADIASAGQERERAFCQVVSEARRPDHQISISLPSGGTFTATASTTADCSPDNVPTAADAAIEVTKGTTMLGEFKLIGVSGKITPSSGLVITSGTLMTPGFWGATPQSAADKSVREVHGTLDAHAAQGGGGLEIPFVVPRQGDLSVGLGIPLSSAGFGDFTGQISLDQTALSKFPLSRALPDSNDPGAASGWKMTKISLSVVPEARRFELSADAVGPSSIGGEVSFYGVLTFDGQVSASVTVSNLAVFQSGNGQTVSNTVRGTLTLLPGRRFDPANPDAAGSYFPVIDVEVSAEFKNYRPAENVSLSGRISWSSNGPLEVEGTLDTPMKGTPVRFTVVGSFADANNWKLYAQFNGGEQGLAIGQSPQLFKLKLLEGTLSRTGGGLQFSLKGEATEIKLGQLTVHSAKIAFTSDCVFAGESTAPEGRLCLLVELESELSFPDKPAVKVNGAVKVDFTTLKFEASGRVTLSPNDPIGKTLGLKDVEMFVSNAGPPRNSVCKSAASAAAADGLYFGLTGQGKALGLDLHFSGAYLGGKNFCLTARIGSASLPSAGSNLTQIPAPPTAAETPPPASCASPDAPTLQDLSFEYSSIDTTHTGVFSGKFCFPEGVRKELGAAGNGVGSVDLKLDTSDGFVGSASYELGRTLWFLNAKNEDPPIPLRRHWGSEN